MNLELLESFGQNFPEEFDGTLDCISLAVTCHFNKYGTLLAVGCNDGRIVIWDFLTRGIAKIISAHVHPVCSLSWSRRGYKLLSASTDNNVAIWDVLTGECDQKIRFPSPVLKVQFNPRNESQFLVCPMRHAAVLIEITGDQKDHKVVPVEDESDMNIVASYDRKGDHIFTGNAKGKISVYTCPELELKSSFRVSQGSTSAAAIRSIEFSRRGNCFLVNTADRVVRVFKVNEALNWGINRDIDPDPIQKLQDLVNRTMWKKCCFSGDGEYICAGSAKQHELNIWERSSGSLVKILHGTKGELLLDVVWHPVRPIIASISSGLVSIWSQNQVENWSAFAPDFKELDENIEYEERESEFDLEDEDKSVELQTEETDENQEVDVTTVDRVAAFYSSDEEDDAEKSLLYLPIAPEIEEPEEVWLPPSENSEEMNKKCDDQKENTSPKKKRPKIHDINLENAPVDEVHPLLASRQQGGNKKGGRAKVDNNKAKDKGK